MKAERIICFCSAYISNVSLFCSSSLELPVDLASDIPKGEHSRRKFSKLVSNHILGNRYFVINLAVMNLKFQAYKIWEDCCGARLGSDRGHPYTRYRANDW
jgi:hypothetical protein